MSPKNDWFCLRNTRIPIIKSSSSVDLSRQCDFETLVALRNATWTPGHNEKRHRQACIAMPLSESYQSDESPRVSTEGARTQGRASETARASGAHPGATPRLSKLWNQIQSCVQREASPEFRQGLCQLVLQYSEAFFLEGETLRPCHFTAPPLTFTDPTALVQSKCYRYPEAEEEFIERQVKEWIEQGICEASDSDFSSPVVVVSKGAQGWRRCQAPIVCFVH